MRVRAAVLEEFGQPLVVQEVELADPVPGRCSSAWRRAASATRTSTPPPAPIRPATPPACSATRARAWSRRSARRDAGRARRPRRDAVRARVRRVHPLPQPADQPLHRDPRHAGPRLPARRHHALLRREGEPLRHFMGTSTFAEYTVMPEIALAKVSPEAPLDGCALFACGLSTGLGAAIYTADVRARLDRGGLRLRPRRPRRRGRLPAPGRGADHRGRPGRRPAADGVAPRRDGHDGRRRRRGRPHPRRTGGYGADYTFEATGNVKVMRQAVESAREAWGWRR